MMRAFRSWLGLGAARPRALVLAIAAVAAAACSLRSTSEYFDGPAPVPSIAGTAGASSGGAGPAGAGGALDSAGADVGGASGSGGSEVVAGAAGAADGAVCGDGVIAGAEDCDGANLAGKKCSDLVDKPSAGTLTCSSCLFNLSGCHYCGDGSANDGEQCDASDLNGATCASAAGVGSTGTLACLDTCLFDVSACSPPLTCNNGKLDPNEPCDGPLFADGKTCASATMVDAAQGALACSAQCTLDPSACTYCGNDKLDPGEDCDGSVPATADCASATGDAAATGTLACAGTCAFDRSGCAFCGDKIVNNGEVCDGGVDPAAKCPGAETGAPTCTSLCAIDFSGCTCTGVMCGATCVDPMSDAMNCGGCGHACETACTKGVCDPFAEPLTSYIVDFAVDPAPAGSIVWLRWDGTKSEVRAYGKINGTTTSVGLPKAVFAYATELVMDGTNAYVIANVPTTGCQIRQVPRTLTGSMLLHNYNQASAVCSGIATGGAAASAAFWAVKAPATGAAGSIEDTVGSPLWQSTTESVGVLSGYFANGTYNVDATFNDVGVSHASGAASLMFAERPKGGTGAKQIVANPSGTYWINAGDPTNNVYAALPMSTGVFQSMHALQGLAADADGVYFGDVTTGTIVATDGTLSSPHPIANTNGSVSRMALDATYVYWLVDAATSNAVVYRAKR